MGSILQSIGGGDREEKKNLGMYQSMNSVKVEVEVACIYGHTLGEDQRQRQNLQIIIMVSMSR